MPASTRSIQVFGIYVAAIGLVLLCVPNMLLSLFGFEPAREPWIRVLGVVVSALGYYYLSAARHGEKAFFRASVHGRVWLVFAFLALVLLEFAEPMLMAFAAIDLAGAAWTWLALRSERKPAA